jgi:hypothetical protein
MESKLLPEPRGRQYGFTKKVVVERDDQDGPTPGGFKMNGLRMYIRPLESEALGVISVFYSRRGEGPYYLWRFEEKLGQWRGSRVASGDFAPRELLMASWKKVPSALQTKLGEHYLD